MDRDLTDEDKLFYFSRNFFTLDGLWMVVAEERLGLEKAVELDLEVWQRFFPIIYRRVARYLGVGGRQVDDFVHVLGFRWKAEGWNFKVNECGPNEAHVTVEAGGCPYLEILKRAGRPDKFSLVCRRVCEPIYATAAHAFNPRIRVTRTKRQGLGDDVCDFHFELAEQEGERKGERGEKKN
ncbi:MAG: hypothetical protein Kow0069_34280 [Promethearchaeota archaeon]